MSNENNTENDEKDEIDARVRDGEVIIEKNETDRPDEEVRKELERSLFGE